MDYKVEDYAKRESRVSPIWGWTLETMKKYPIEDLHIMTQYFADRDIFVGVATNTFMELVNEVQVLQDKTKDLPSTSSRS